MGILAFFFAMFIFFIARVYSLLTSDDMTKFTILMIIFLIFMFNKK